MIARVKLTPDGVRLAFAQDEETSDPQTSEGVEEEEHSEVEAEEDHAAEEGGHAESVEAPNPILPAKNEVVWGGLAFVILLVAMVKFLMPKIQEASQKRTNRIQGDLDAAEQAKADAQGILDEYQRQLADAKNESNRIIEEARQAADQLRRDLMQRAEAEAAELRQRTQAEITAAQDRAMADLQARVADLAIELAEKVVERNLDRDTNAQLINSYIQQVSRN